MIKNGLVVQELAFGNSSPINCLQPMKNGFVVGGVGGFVNVYEFNPCDRFEAAKQILLPDPESIITGMANTIAEGTLLVEINTNQILKFALSNNDLKVVKY
jgi:hypothetical protein